MLDVDAGQAAVAGTSQPVEPDALREGGLETDADCMAALSFFGLLIEPVLRLDLM